jgi:hypothetical protein
MNLILKIRVILSPSTSKVCASDTHCSGNDCFPVVKWPWPDHEISDSSGSENEDKDISDNSFFKWLSQSATDVSPVVDQCISHMANLILPHCIESLLDWQTY